MSDELTELPEGWVWATIGDVSTIESNLVDPVDHQNSPHIAPNHIESGTGKLLDYTTIAEDKVFSPKHAFRPDQILYSKIRPYLAKAVLINFSGLCSADMYPIAAHIEPIYLHTWLISSKFTELASRSQGRTVLPKINQPALQKIKIPVPPINEQRRIVDKIEGLRDRHQRAKQALEAIPELCDRFRQSVLAAAFRGDLTADWREENPDVEPASVLLEKIRRDRYQKWEEKELEKFRLSAKLPKDDKWKAKYLGLEPIDESDLPALPQNWCWAAAEEVVEPGAEIVYGIVQPGPHIPDGIPYVRGQDIQDGQILLNQLLRTSPEIAERYARASLCEGDVLLGIIRATKVVIVPKELTGGNLTQGTARFRPSRIITTDYLANWLDSPYAQTWLHAHYRGIDMPGLNLKDVRRLPIPVAPLEEQKKISSQLSIFQKHRAIVHQSFTSVAEQLSLLNQSILAKAFRGELVEQDPNDEPASVLLERIRAEREQADNGKKTKGKRGKQLKLEV